MIAIVNGKQNIIKNLADILKLDYPLDIIHMILCLVCDNKTEGETENYKIRIEV